jgi:hypothetical protein
MPLFILNSCLELQLLGVHEIVIFTNLLGQFVLFMKLSEISASQIIYMIQLGQLQYCCHVPSQLMHYT